MSTLGGFLISVGADLGKFETDLGRANKIAEAQAEKIKGAFLGIAGALGVGFSIDWITGFIDDSLKAQDAMSKLSQKVGITTESLSGIELAAKQAGVESEALEKGLIKLGQSSAQAGNGAKEQAAAYAAIGVSVKDASGNLKPLDALLGEVADKFEGYRDSTEKTVLATTLFGKAGAQLIPLLNAGSAGLAEYTKMAEDFGLVVGGKVAKDAERFNDSLEQLHFVSEGVANQIASVLAPALADLAEKTVAFFRSDTWKDWLAKISAGTKLVVDNLDKIGGALVVIGEIAAIALGAKFVGAIALATFNLVELTLKTIAASSAAAEMGLTFTTASNNILISTAASVKAIGLLPLALGVVTAAFAGWQVGKYLSDNFVEARLAGIALVDSLLTGWERVKEGALIAWTELSHGFDIAVGSIKSGLALIVQGLSYVAISQGNLADATKMQGFADSLRASAGPAEDLATKIAKISTESDAAVEAIHKQTGAMADQQYEAVATAAALVNFDNALAKIDEKAAGKLVPNSKDKKEAEAYADALRGIAAAAATAVQSGVDHERVQKDVAKAIADLGKEALKTAPNVLGLAGAQDVAAKAAEQLDKLFQKDAETLANLRGQFDPLVRAQQSYIAIIIKANAEYQEEAKQIALSHKGSAELALAKQILADKTELAQKALDEETESIKKQYSVLEQLQRDAADSISLLGLPERDRAIAESVQKITNSYAAMSQSEKENFNRYNQSIEHAQEVTAGLTAKVFDLTDATKKNQEVTGEWVGIWSGALTKAFQGFNDALLNGGNLMKSLKDVAKDVANSILQYFEKLAIINPLLNAIFGTAAGGGTLLPTLANAAGGILGGGSGAGSGSILSKVGTAYSAWKNGGSFFGNLFGGSSAMGPPDAFTGSHAAAAGSNSTFSTYAPWAAAILGAAYGWKQGGDTPGKAASAAAYGTAAYVGTGLATGALTAVPIVGWVALAAIIVDKLSGGKLFGTKFATQTQTQAFDFNNAGASASFTAYQTGQKSFFRGQKSRVVDLAVPEDVDAALASYFDALKQTTSQEAKALGVELPDLVSASFVQVFDKKGKLISQLGTIFGEKFDEPFEEFQKRLMAANIVNVAALADGAVKTITDKYLHASADVYLAIATGVADIETGIKAGFKTLNGADTLQGVYDFISSVQLAGESLDDAYHRIAKATADYFQIVANVDAQIAQFMPQGTDFEQAFASVVGNSKAVTDSLNAAAKAAGLDAARTEDLTKIRQLEALQVAALVTGLQARIEQEVADLFGDPIQKQIDSKTKEADDLQSRIDKLYAVGAIQQALLLEKQQAQLRADAQAIADKKKADDEKLQKALQAQSLTKDLADFSLFTGKTLKEIETQFGISGDDLAKALGIDPSKLDSYFSDQIDAAKAFVDMPELQKITNEYLSKIFEAITGSPLQPALPDGTGPIASRGGGHTIPIPGVVDPAVLPATKGTPTTTSGPTVDSGLRSESQQRNTDALLNVGEGIWRLVTLAEAGNKIAQDGAAVVAGSVQQLVREAKGGASAPPRIVPRSTPVPA